MSAIKNRIMVAVLSLSATGLVGLALDESYTGAAVIPTRGDVPTLGFGSTTHADGRPVRMGDTTTPSKALARTLQYIQVDEADMRKTLEGVALHQAEYDVYIDWRYQYGATAWRNSVMLQELRVSHYTAACGALLEYRYMTSAQPLAGFKPYKFNGSGQPIRWRFDCSTPGNRICAGVWTRQQTRHAQCMAAQS